MRKLISILVLVPAFIYLIGYQPLFFAMQLHLKNEAREEFASTNCDIEILKFSAGEFAALERPDGNDHEFRIDGSLYDVKAIERDGNTVTVYAYADKAETGLIHKLMAWLEHENHPHKSPHHFSFNGFVADVLYDVQFLQTLNQPQQVSLAVYNFPLLQANIPVSSPPPDLA